ncbi:MAG: cupin domain-containing protein [Methylovulum sp.]|jgi:mannose-6-phosphate isomerase-like protein (cupin superfamily)|nr:cupin domain-containing protein [Methylovulum sp.]MCF7997536.1 cupin domain-containing protein [Methylovulum sp.]
MSKILNADESNEYFFDEGCFILELSNHSDDPDVSIARARVKPGVTTQWHRLQGIIERYVMLSGTGLVEVGELPAQVVTVGDVVIIPKQCPQRIRNIGTDDLVFLAICSPRFVPEAYQAIA